jgi:hypothetical protein
MEVMQSLIHKLHGQFPAITFRADSRFYWSPEKSEVAYKANARGNSAEWALLHETSHALLGHHTYRNDFELVEMEVAAWERAKELSAELQLGTIDENHVQDCLDTYRDWLHKRCLCPECGNRSFQQDPEHYSCYNCATTWHVTPSRFCRSYRLVKATPKFFRTIG